MPRVLPPTPRVRRVFVAARMVALGATLVGVGSLPALGGSVAAAAQVRATASAAGPTCVPAALNTSDVLPGTGVQVSPLPGSLDASPHTQISFIGVPAAALSAIGVSGSRSGRHSGVLRAYPQGDGASFVVAHPLTPGESVTVSGKAAGHDFSYHFNVSVPDPLPTLPAGPQPAGGRGDVQSFRSRPDLRPPTVAVSTRAAAGTAPGFLFAAPYSGPGQDGPMIFDNAGQVVWFAPLRTNTYAANLQVQQYQGKPVLTYWQGYIPPQGFGEGSEMIDNSAYHTIAVVNAGNGYSADLHDFEIADANTAYLTVFNPIRCNLSAVGGPSNAAVTDAVFQQVDLGTGLVRREWHSLDHVSLRQSHQPARAASTQQPLDAFHINSISPIGNGALLVSSRSTWSVYVIAASTGQVTTSIGGTQSSVKMGAGTATAWQHDATVLPDGTISIFDNGAVPAVEPQSRGIVEQLNPATGSVSLVRQYVHPGKALLAGSQGNFQTLPNGNAFLGWGSQPYLTEFSPSGTVLFDAHMPAADQSYRTYRFPWVGAPVHPPSLAVSRAGHALQACASWNGSTQVASWRVLAGSSRRRLAAVTTAARGGFETCIATASAGPYVQVQALGSAGELLGSSATVRA